MSSKPAYDRSPIYRVMLGNLIKVVVDFNEKMNFTQNTRKVNCSNTLALKLINEFEWMGFIKVIKSGRGLYIEFTDRGDDLRRHLRGIRNLIGEAVTNVARTHTTSM